ncbi:ribonuclease III [Hyphobacterium sp.]|uniref:ribonuclease III n=1 Tax=Hyphobacterium sp. TaxID=2004662 RepID=UPI003BA975CC
MNPELDALQERIGYHFKDMALLQRAMTHASFGDGDKSVANNERLEFLGDRVLGLLASETMFLKFKAAKEGRLAPLYNSLVDKKACEKVARAFDLGPGLRLSPAEDRVGGRNKASILADATEAVMAAVYLDGGLEAVRGVFERGWGEAIANLTAKPRNPKSDLQELAAKRNLGHPHYEVLEQAGPDHKPVFVVKVELGRLDPCEGQGGSKQSAERAAATAMLQRISGNE